jgi:hypothetical protein
MSSFRPTPFTRAFRSLDAFAADIDAAPVQLGPAEPEPVLISEQQPPPVDRRPDIVIMDFEQKTIRPSPPLFGRPMWNDETCSCCRRLNNDRHDFEYELKVLQMKLNWLMLIIFMLVCYLFFRRSAAS